MKTISNNSMAGLACSVLALAAASNTAVAQQRVVPDTYVAITTAMQPAGAQLKADIIRWSSEQERTAVIDALGSTEAAAKLKDLPTMGAVWRENSAVGNSIKYAHRQQTADGGERVTLITEKRIAYTSFQPWVAENPVMDVSDDYTVIELVVPSSGSGHGTMSLGADISIDAESALVSLVADDAEPLLTDVGKAPKPYWANQD